MRQISFILLAFLFTLGACNSVKKTSEKAAEGPKVYENEHFPYRASETRTFDLLHTLLKVSFDWEKQHLKGYAELSLTPYFYPSNQLILDAKGMDLGSISLLSEDGKNTNLSFSYDSSQIKITLPKKYKRGEKIKLIIQYVAKPNELKSQGSKAIKDDKGLYFINPLGKDDVKPKQIWTQGETEASSCWFPTIDKPNERCTQEIYITVENKYKTLSNGKFISSVNNTDGTRTDYWKQDLPHAPYLFMMSIGEYAVIKDTWQGVPLTYHVEPKDSADALLVFGNTPKMLTFYSDLLGVKYPWDKYAQVLLRDYVSGAMENSSATVFANFVFRNKQQLIDKNWENIIAHELFHQWFGDYVTCESWSNLPLNESFATYGEYLWVEHAYGKMEADLHLYKDWMEYLADHPWKEIIRFKYEDKEDMFDDHSYEKGALVLHQLRDLVGDEAFFASLNLYLKTNAFKSVEIHNLRLAFEEVTGLDLNWYFNQWFLSKGHPVLHVDYKVKSDSLILHIHQTQNLKDIPVFRLPLAVDVYENGKATRHEIVTEHAKDTFILKVGGTVDLVSVDAKHVLCGEVHQKLTPEQALFKFNNTKLFRDKMSALKAVKNDTSTVAWQVLQQAVKDTFPYFRAVGINYLGKGKEAKSDDFKELLVNLIKTDPVSSVRSEAIVQLAKNFASDSLMIPIYKKALEDSSLNVKTEAISALSEIKREDALLRATELEKIEDAHLIYTLCEIYSDVKDESKINYYRWAISHTEGYFKSGVIELFTEYLKTKGHDLAWKGFKTLRDIAIYDNDKEIRIAAGLAIHNLHKQHLLSIEDVKKDIADQEKSGKKDSYDLKMLKEKLAELEAKEKEILELIKQVIQAEKNLSVLETWKIEGFEDK